MSENIFWNNVRSNHCHHVTPEIQFPMYKICLRIKKQSNITEYNKLSRGFVLEKSKQHAPLLLAKFKECLLKFNIA